MAITKKLIHFKKKDTFNSELSKGNILTTSIVFILDAKLIYTHGTYYPFSYTTSELDTKFSDVAEGALSAIEVYVSDTEPTDNNYLLWIDSDDVLRYHNSTGWITLNMLKDPNDGKIYVRKNKLWVPLPNEAFVGTTEPTGEEILWINPETLETKYKKEDGTWELIKGGALTETVNVSLSSNQTDADLTGAQVTVSYEGITKTEVWDGRIITFQIPPNVPYTISAAAIENYTKPADVSYTAEAGKTRDVELVYNSTLVRLSWVFNYNDGRRPTVLVQVEDGSPTEHTIPDNILIPTGATFTVTPQPLSGYKTPEPITLVAEGTDLTVEVEYIYPKLYIVRRSNLSEKLTCSATVTYGSSSKTVNFSSSVDENNVPIPYGTSFNVTFSDVEGYKTPSSVSGTAQYQTESAVGTYQSEFATVAVTGLDGTPTGYTITVKLGDTVLGTSTDSSKLFKIPFGTSYTVSASDIDGFTTPAAQTFTAGLTSRSITMKYIYEPTKDLSMYDIHGVKLANRTTANCYIVKEPGTYKFPLVYGNAIKNGQVNSAAYTRVDNSDTSKQLGFQNAKVAAISNPYIEEDLESSGSTSLGSIDIAELSVCDTDGVFSDISIIEGTPCKFIQFTIKKVPHTGANGVISALGSATNKIVWSWHIWVWEDDLTPITITNATGNNYDILPYNLGSKWDEDTKVHIKNWYYQWGRSVPQICPSAYNSNTKATNYGVLTITVSESAGSSLPMLELGKSFLHFPATFYKGDSNYNYNWIKREYIYNYWDANCTTEGANDNKVVKTVYDPCPVGYCVGNGNVFTGFSTSNVVGSFSNGYKFKANSSDTTGIFFPASGWMSRGNGYLSFVGSGGDVWSSALDSLNYAYRLGFDSSYVDPLISSSRALGFSVRPVKEQ